jgi:enoyl-[acyl-carrier protein] reductase II
MDLDRLWHRGKEFLGVRYPIICGAMTWISDSELVAAVSRTGAFASLAAGNMPPDALGREIERTRSATDKPFAVNLITIAPRYREHLRLVAELKVPMVIFAGSFPRGSEIEAVKRAGSKAVCFASSTSIAQRMIRSGADALVLEGSEAGGHIGHVSLVILLQQILFEVDEVPIFVAGGIATGRLVTHLLLMGASGVQLGTRFVISEECRAHPRFKEAFLRARARDAVASPAVGSDLHVVPVRAIRNRGTEEFADLQVQLLLKQRQGMISRAQAQEQVETYWMGALRRAVEEGDVEGGSLMAGQSVGLAGRIQPLQEIVDELVADAKAELHRIHENLCSLNES